MRSCVDPVQLRSASLTRSYAQLQSLWDNPGMAFMYTSNLSEEQVSEFRAAVRKEMLKRSAESGKETWGAEMLGNVVCAWTAEK